MSKILLDTSVIIDFLRRHDKERTLLYTIADNDLYISVITHTELYSGRSIWEKDIIKESLEKVLSGLTILPLESDISQKAGYIKAYHHDNSLLDCIIAATAVTHNMHLATLNTKDFKKIEETQLFSSN